MTAGPQDYDNTTRPARREIARDDVFTFVSRETRTHTALQESGVTLQPADSRRLKLNASALAAAERDSRGRKGKACEETRAGCHRVGSFRRSIAPTESVGFEEARLPSGPVPSRVTADEAADSSTSGTKSSSDGSCEGSPERTTACSSDSVPESVTSNCGERNDPKSSPRVGYRDAGENSRGSHSQRRHSLNNRRDTRSTLDPGEAGRAAPHGIKAFPRNGNGGGSQATCRRRSWPGSE